MKKTPTSIYTGRGLILVAGAGFEPTTSGFSVLSAHYLKLSLATIQFATAADP